MAGMKVQKHQAGKAKDQGGDSEDIDEPLPGEACVAALVKVVEVRDPAAIGLLEFHVAGFSIDCQPGIRARTLHRDVDLILRPFCVARSDPFGKLLTEPLAKRGWQRRVSFDGKIRERGDHLVGKRDRKRGYLGFDGDVAGMIQRDSSDREQQHPDQTNGRTDPVPLNHCSHPKGATLLVSAGFRGGLRRFRMHAVVARADNVLFSETVSQ